MEFKKMFLEPKDLRVNDIVLSLDKTHCYIVMKIGRTIIHEHIKIKRYDLIEKRKITELLESFPPGKREVIRIVGVY